MTEEIMAVKVGAFRERLKEAMRTKFGSLERLLCVSNNNTDVIANCKQIMGILRKTYEAVGTPQLHSGDFSMPSHNLVCGIGIC